MSRPSIQRLQQIVFSALEAFAAPLVMLAATPQLLRILGEDHFGIWVLVNSVAAFTSLAYFGFPESTITFGAQSLAKGEKDEAQAIYFTSLLSCLLSIFLLLGFAIGLIHLFGPLRVIQENTIQQLSGELLAGTLLFSCRMLENTVLSYFKLHLLYQFSSGYSFVSKFIGITVQIIVLAKTHSMIEGFLANTTITLFVSTVAFIHASIKFDISLKLEGANRYYRIFKRNFHFSFQTWVQSVLSVTNTNLDKIIVGKLMGPITLSYYSIGSVVINQLHNVFGSGFQVLLPEFSKFRAAAPKRIFRHYVETLVLSVFLYLLAVALLLSKHPDLIHLWLKEKANGLETLLPYFLFYEFCFMLNIVPYYLLLAYERVNRINVINMLMFSLLLFSMFFLVQGWSLQSFILMRAMFVLISTLFFHVQAIRIVSADLSH